MGLEDVGVVVVARKSRRREALTKVSGAGEDILEVGNGGTEVGVGRLSRQGRGFVGEGGGGTEGEGRCFTPGGKGRGGAKIEEKKREEGERAVIRRRDRGFCKMRKEGRRGRRQERAQVVEAWV